MKYYYIPLESKTTFQSFVTGSEFAMYDTTIGNKKETISSAKRLLLWHKSLKCVFETDSQKVREILDLSTTAKSVKISAKELPGHLQLFCQSTSANRGVETVIMLTTDDSCPVAGCASIFGQNSGQKRKADAVESPPTANKKSATEQTAPTVRLNWDAVETMIKGDSPDCWDEESFMIGADDVHQFVDEEVENTLWSPVQTWLDEAKTLDWYSISLTASKKWMYFGNANNFSIEGNQLFRAEARDSKGSAIAKLVYFDTADDIISILETKEHAIVIGSAGCHPFIDCDTFRYGNSDGSSPESTVESPTPHAVIDHMKETLVVFCKDECH